MTFSLSAYATPIHTYREDTPISNAITLTRVKEFHSGHNISYSYIKADLSNENTGLKLLKSPSGPDVLENMGTLVSTDPNTVAALNGDFFSLFKGTQGFSLGIEVSDGKLNQSPINPDTMATVFLSNDAISMGYIKFTATVVAPNGQTAPIRHINKPTTYYGDILMYTSDFNGGMSPAPGDSVLEVVVENGTVMEFRRKMGPVKIPENGCVLVVSEGSSMFFAKNFNVGDPIRVEYAVTPDLSEIETAFGGGGMLVADGQPLKTFSHVISGNQPRSAIGVDKSGKTLYLVAVDGRQEGSRGMSMSELATLMHSLGCYQAINLDGGGSTRMVASTLQNPQLHAVNSPTENRKVINAVGLTHSAQPGEAQGIILTPSENTVFVGEPVNLSAVIHDGNLRALTGNVTYSSDYGTVTNNVFIPNKGGNATVYAHFGEAQGKADIFVVDKAAGIDLPHNMRLDVNSTAKFAVNVFDHSGHFVKITDLSSFSVSSSDPSVVSVTGNTLTAHKSGTATITVKRDGAVSHISVVAGAEKQKYTDSFENLSGSYKGYPATVPGAFEITDQFAQSGGKSGKLSFDFTAEDDVTKGAYFALSSRVQLHDTAKKIEISMYAEKPIQHELRAQFIDANGEIAIASFGKSFEAGKWNRLTADIPQNAQLPLRLDRIYVLYLAGEPKDSGSVFLDDLTFDSVSDAKYAAAPANIYDLPQPHGTGQFAVGALLSANSNTLFTRLANNKIEKSLKSDPSSMLIGELDAFNVKEDTNALYIQLNTFKGGIRNTDSSQWDKMAAAIKTTQKKNVFILSDNSIFGESDYENQVFQDFLAATGKNVYVICGGAGNTYKNINGVNYFTLNRGFGESTDLTRIEGCNVLEFSFGEQTTFGWKSIF